MMMKPTKRQSITKYLFRQEKKQLGDSREPDLGDEGIKILSDARNTCLDSPEEVCKQLLLSMEKEAPNKTIRFDEIKLINYFWFYLLFSDWVNCVRWSLNGDMLACFI